MKICIECFTGEEIAVLPWKIILKWRQLRFHRCKRFFLELPLPKSRSFECRAVINPLFQAASIPRKQSEVAINPRSGGIPHSERRGSWWEFHKQTSLQIFLPYMCFLARTFRFLIPTTLAHLLCVFLCIWMNFIFLLWFCLLLLNFQVPNHSYLRW